MTITANNTSKVYDGLASGPLDVTSYSDPSASGSPLIYGLATPYGAGKDNVGVYNAQVWSTQSGYDITLVGGQLTVTPAALTITGGTASSKVYDGTTAATITGASLSGVVGSDTVILSGLFNDKNVGTSKTVTAYLAGGDDANYTFNLSAPSGLAMLTWFSSTDIESAASLSAGTALVLATRLSLTP